MSPNHQLNLKKSLKIQVAKYKAFKSQSSINFQKLREISTTQENQRIFQLDLQRQMLVAAHKISLIASKITIITIKRNRTKAVIFTHLQTTTSLKRQTRCICKHGRASYTNSAKSTVKTTIQVQEPNKTSSVKITS